MNAEDISKLSVDELVRTSIKAYRQDPIFSPQYKKFFTRGEDKREIGEKERDKEVKGKAREAFFMKKTLPSNHRIEANFSPYLKANKKIQRFSSKNIFCKTFDLVEKELKEFKDPATSLSLLFRSKSKIRVSRLPLYTPIEKKVESSNDSIQNRCKTASSCRVSVRSIKSFRSIPRDRPIRCKTPMLTKSLKTRFFF